MHKVMGISSSPINKGNTDTFLSTMMEEASVNGFDTEIVNLSKLTIKHCIHCNFCLSKQKPDKYCSLNDDAQAVFEKLKEADIIVLASPVYFMRTSGMMATFIDRMRVFIFGNELRGALRNKIGVSAAVSWARNGGVETTHLSHLYAFMTLEMIPASVHKGISPLGASAVASKHGAGVFDPNIKLGIQEDEPGLDSGIQIMRRAIVLAGLIHKS